MKLFIHNLNLVNYRDLRLFIYFIFVLSLTGFVDNFVLTLNNSISSVLNFLCFSIIIVPLLVILSLKNNQKILKIDNFAKSLFIFCLTILILETLQTIFFISNYINFRDEYLKFFFTLNYPLSWCYILLIYITIHSFFTNSEKNYCLELFIILSFLFSLYVIFGMIFVDYFYSDTNFGMFNRRFPLSQAYSYYFVFACYLVMFFETNLTNNIQKKIFFLLFFSFVILNSKSLGAILIILSIYPLFLYSLILDLKNSFYRNISYFIFATMLILGGFLIFKIDFYFKEHLYYIYLVFNKLEFLNFIFFPDHLGGKEHSVLVRYNSLIDSLKLIPKNFIHGGGVLLNSLNQYMGSSSHQSILYPLSAYGLFGFISFIIMLASLFINNKKINLKKFISIIAFFPIFFGNMLFHNHIPIFFALFFYIIVYFDNFQNSK